MLDEELRASAQDGTYPRPQLVRPHWLDLSGEWDFAYDDDVTVDGRAGIPDEFTRTIVVPYPPESPLSGINDTGYHPVVWYRRRVGRAELEPPATPTAARCSCTSAPSTTAPMSGSTVVHVASHEGGHTPVHRRGPGLRATEFDIVVRAEDDPHDLSQPRGKQDWQLEPHSIWYRRTTGIWQPVWLESVPRQHVTRVAWRPDIPNDRVHLTLELAARPTEPARAHITLHHGEQQLAEVTVTIAGPVEQIAIAIPALGTEQGFDELLWTPERPVLIDARVELIAGESTDVVSSYLGLRWVETVGGEFLLNSRPYPIRGVLSQGYWPQSHLAAPSPAALRAEVELIKELGFTTARLHQKVEDPRLMYWADRLGLLAVDRDAERLRALGCRGDAPHAGMDRRHPPRLVAPERRRLGPAQRELGRARTSPWTRASRRSRERCTT